jgi:hypothetical protein
MFALTNRIGKGLGGFPCCIQCRINLFILAVGAGVHQLLLLGRDTFSGRLRL